MSIRKTAVTMAIMVTTLVLVVGALQATPPRSSRLFDWKLEPLEPPKGPGVIDMVFEFTPTKLCSIKGCTETEIRVITKGGLEFLGPQSWKQQVKYGETYSQVIQVSVPPNDTCGIWIEMHSPVYSRTRAVAYFITTADSVDFWKGYPQGPRTWVNHTELARAALSEEERQEIVDVRVDFGGINPRFRKMAHELVPDMKPTEQEGIFIARMTRDNLLVLGGWGVYCRVLREPTPPPTR